MEQSVWKHMYLELARSVTDVIDLMPKTRENDAIKGILIRAMQRAEEIYMGSHEGETDDETEGDQRNLLTNPS